ncbi:MAG: class 1 fructose-bisphosphatase [Sphingobacteriia bacterium]
MSDTPKILTLQQFILSEQKDHPKATGELSQLLRDISLAARIVSREVNRAGLSSILGEANLINVQGEAQMKLDLYADHTFLNALRLGGITAVYASEEQEDVVPIGMVNGRYGKYAVLCDPLDGSSNVDVNVSIGTIFSVFRRKTQECPGTLEDCLQHGYEQIAAGYVLYGSSTMLVYTTRGHGVNGFTLEPSLGEFILSHPNIRIPEKAKYYSVNEANRSQFTEPVKRYLEYVDQRNQGEKPGINARYIGSLVADFHRNLLQGGIYLYPGLKHQPAGKLRLMYEANPMALLVETAGGRATDGTRRILDLEPTALHQRTPLYLGSKQEMDLLESMHKEAILAGK